MALAMLEYGLSTEAPIIVVTGEIGAGKTTLIRHLLNQFDNKFTVGLISNTHNSFGELMQWVCMAFGIDYQGKEKVSLYQAFVDFLLNEYAQGKRTILIIDEAQNMDSGTLEELRLISNINADKNVVLQLLIIGQPDLRETLRQKKLEQFAQRIAVDYHLGPLDLKETREYIQHRLVTAAGNKNTFQPDAILAVYQLSQGVPRLINSLCDQVLVYAFAEGRQRVTEKLVRDLVADKQVYGLFGAGKLQYDPPVDEPKGGVSAV